MQVVWRFYVAHIVRANYDNTWDSRQTLHVEEAENEVVSHVSNAAWVVSTGWHVQC